MTKRTQAELRMDMDVSQPVKEPGTMKVRGTRKGLVLFPKYMLINNCHLKQTDLQRFQREQDAERAAAESGLGDALSHAPVIKELQPSAVKYGEASWGAPLLREEGFHWAGSSLPAGRGQRSSNPFRM